MTTAPPTPANPRYIERGRHAARKRWGPPRLVRLDGLHSNVRELVLALVDAAREQAAREEAGDVS